MYISSDNNVEAVYIKKNYEVWLKYKVGINIKEPGL